MTDEELQEQGRRRSDIRQDYPGPNGTLLLNSINEAFEDAIRFTIENNYTETANGGQFGIIRNSREAVRKLILLLEDGNGGQVIPDDISYISLYKKMRQVVQLTQDDITTFGGETGYCLKILD